MRLLLLLLRPIVEQIVRGLATQIRPALSHCSGTGMDVDDGDDDDGGDDDDDDDGRSFDGDNVGPGINP